jgi:hypothetical protein
MFLRHVSSWDKSHLLALPFDIAVPQNSDKPPHVPILNVGGTDFLFLFPVEESDKNGVNEML